MIHREHVVLFSTDPRVERTLCHNLLLANIVYISHHCPPQDDETGLELLVKPHTLVASNDLVFVSTANVACCLLLFPLLNRSFCIMFVSIHGGVPSKVPSVDLGGWKLESVDQFKLLRLRTFFGLLQTKNKNQPIILIVMKGMGHAGWSANTESPCARQRAPRTDPLVHDSHMCPK